MSLELIERALKRHLSQMSPNIATSYEGASFEPTKDVPYQYVQLTPRRPENPTMGDGYYREVGEFQIFLCYPIGKGTGEIRARAELVRKHFKRATTLIESGLDIIVPTTPQVAGTTIAGDRLVVPVLINYSAGVFE